MVLYNKKQEDCMLETLENVNNNEWYYKNCLISERSYLDPVAKLTLKVSAGLRYKIILKEEDKTFTNRILTDLNRIEKSNGNSNTWLENLEILCSTLSAEEVIDIVTESLCKKCKRCESTNLVKCGLTKFKKQRWLCRGCGRKQTIV